MSGFIPHDKLVKLREDAKNGDEMAKKILMAQLNDEDFSGDLETYFKPQVEEPGQEPEQEQSIEEAAETPQEEAKQAASVQENPVLTGKIEQNEISDGILGLINACDKKILELANNPDLSEATKKGALSILQEIKQSSLDNLEKYAKLSSSFAKKYVDEE